MSKTTLPKSDRDALAKIGLDGDAPGLVAVVAASDPSMPALAPQGIDPRTMKVSDIVFDPRLLEEFDDLEDANVRNLATRKIFDLYKSRGRDTDRHRRLQDEIGNFIRRIKVERKVPEVKGHVKDKVRRTQPQSELLQTLAALGINSVDDLKGLLPEKEEA